MTVYDIIKVKLQYYKISEGCNPQMEYKLSFGNYAGIFALPDEAADKYINEASLSDLKVLIYVFRHSGEPLNSGEACKALETDSKQLKSSLEFWSKRNIIKCKAGRESADAAKSEQEKTRLQTAAHRALDIPVQYGQEEIAKKAQGNEEIKFLLEAAAGSLGRLISPAECSILIYLYEGAGLPADVIMMIISYCVSAGKGNIRYIEKMALGWAEEGIDTHEKAESKICRLEAKRSFEGKVRTVMGIQDRAFSTEELQHIGRWCEWNIPLDLVKLAYDISVSNTGKLSFAYMNKILSTWHEKGYKTVEQARNENRRGGRKGGNSAGKTPSYDIDEYVRLSLKKLNNE